jgi:hypothetical protein
MSSKDDDEKAYTTDDDMLGRSIRRGTRKAIKALTFGIISPGNPLRNSLGNLAQDALEELPEAIERSKNRDSDD